MFNNGYIQGDKIMNTLMLSLASDLIKTETDLDFSNNLSILEMRLRDKSVNELIAEIKQNKDSELKYTEE